MPAKVIGKFRGQKVGPQSFWKKSRNLLHLARTYFDRRPRVNSLWIQKNILCGSTKVLIRNKLGCLCVFLRSNILIKVADRLFVCPRSATIPNSTESSLLASDVPCPVTQVFTPMLHDSEVGSNQLLRDLPWSMFQTVSIRPLSLFFYSQILDKGRLWLRI